PRPRPGPEGPLPVLPREERRVRRHRVCEEPQGSPGQPEEVPAEAVVNEASKPGLPTPADFAPPPTESDRARWTAADRAARPARVDRLRARFEAAAIDAYFGIRREHMRYLTGFALADGEEKVAGTSGQFLVSGD